MIYGNEFLKILIQVSTNEINKEIYIESTIEWPFKITINQINNKCHRKTRNHRKGTNKNNLTYLPLAPEIYCPEVGLALYINVNLT